MQCLHVQLLLQVRFAENSHVKMIRIFLIFFTFVIILNSIPAQSHARDPFKSILGWFCSLIFESSLDWIGLDIFFGDKNWFLEWELGFCCVSLWFLASGILVF